MATTSGVSGAGSSSSGNGVNRFSQMTSEEFLKVLITELQNQDPTAPQDSSKLLEQLSSIRNIESQVSLQDTLKSLVSQNQLASAGNLIGKVVEGLDDANDEVTGVVSSIRVQAGKVVLELDDGTQLSMDRVTSISSRAAAGTAAE